VRTGAQNVTIWSTVWPQVTLCTPYVHYEPTTGGYCHRECMLTIGNLTISSVN
jgi:hypothetical protein